METNNKVMIPQEDLEMLRWDASRAERSTTAAVVSTAIAVGAAVAVGYVVYSDIKDRSEHHTRMANIQAEHDELRALISELTAKE